MQNMWSSMKAINRRSFLRNGLSAAGAATAGAGLLTTSTSAAADDVKGNLGFGGFLTRGDAAMLRFAAAAEIIETDFWVQYNELAGIQDSEVPGGTGNPAYTAAVSVLDSDMAQYIHDNTDDEFTHQNFLNAYLASKGAATISLEHISHFNRQPGNRFERQIAHHQPDTTHARHQLVDPLSGRQP